MPIGHALVDELGSVTEAATGRMRLAIPEVFTDPQLSRLVRNSNQVQIGRLAEMLIAGSDPRDTDLPEETVRAVQSGVRMQVGLSPLLRLFSLGHELVWDWAFARIAAEARTTEEMSAATGISSSWLFAFIDAATTRLAEAYDREREAWFSSALAERAETIAAVLEGHEQDAAAVSARLRYDVRRHHVGVLVWASDPTSMDPQSKLNGAVRSLAEMLGVQTTFVSPFGSHAVRAWLTRSRRFDTDELASFDTWTGPPGTLVAIGTPGSDLDGFRRSQREASEARRLASLGSTPPPLTRYDRVAAAALATVDGDQAASFVRRVLGPLADPDPGTRRLAETLAVYLAESRNRRRAGERLIVHANTVSYRVKRAEELLGHKVGEDTLDLRLALAILPYVSEGD